MSRRCWMTVVCWCAAVVPLWAQQMPPGGMAPADAQPPIAVKANSLEQKTLTTMPVKEISVFKDGYVFLMHEGTLPTDAQGNVLLNNLPQPVLGTFWTYVPQPGASISAVVAGVQPVTTERKAINLREVITANPGAEVTVNECGVKYAATLLGIGPKTQGIPTPVAPFSAVAALKSKEDTVYLRTADGVREVELSRIQDIDFKTAPKTTVPQTQDRDIISLRLKWNTTPPKNAQVGMFYLQQGIRWIPEYQFVLDGKGKATVKLQASLENELIDLDDMTMRLVVGVPNFRFKGEIDPIALQQTVAQLSRDDINTSNSNNFSNNAVMTQVPSYGRGNGTMPPIPTNATGPEDGDAEKTQDLFVFSLNHITLKKGQRMIVPLAEYTVPYEDIYTVDLSAMPPREALTELRSNNTADLARLTTSTVKHILRLHNTSPYPITTAPMLVMQDGKPLAQSMTAYTAIKGMLDLELTTAIDVQVRQSEKEVKRTQSTITWKDPKTNEVIPLTRIDLAGTVSLTNYRDTTTRVEVTRRVAGNMTNADHDGTVTTLGMVSTPDVPMDVPAWWGWYTWPSWWTRYNSLGQATWDLTLKPGETTDLGYLWNYYWR